MTPGHISCWLRSGCFAFFLSLAAPAGLGQGMIRDCEIEQILREYATPIFEAAGLHGDDITLNILNDPSRNAFVAGGQNMFLHTGLITRIETPEELKGVIAHETGHISAGHNITRGKALEASLGIAWLTLGLSALAVAVGAPEAGIALATGAGNLSARNFFWHTRVEESAADQAAMTFLAATNQSADGLLSFMEEMRREEVLSERRQDPYTRTHPVSSERIAALRERAHAITHLAKPQTARSTEQLAMMKAKLIGFLHEPEQVLAAYPLTDTTSPALYARAISAYRQIDIKTADRLMDTLISRAPHNPYFHELKGQILFENGHAALSVAPHRLALAYGPESALLLVNLARSLLATRVRADAREARSLLQRAVIIEPDNTLAWGELGRAHGLIQEEGPALLAFAEQAFVLKDFRRAGNFAHRALVRLPESSPMTRRAKDILNVAQQNAGVETGRGKRRRR